MLEPTHDAVNGTIKIPRVPGATHYIDDAPVRGTVVLDGPTTVTAKPNPGSHFREGAVTEWHYDADGPSDSDTDEDAVDDEDADKSEPSAGEKVSEPSEETFQ